MAQSVVAITPTAASLTAGTGSANEVVVTFVATMSPPSPAFAGTWSISGLNAGLFRIDPATGLCTVGPADIAVGTYFVNVTATP